MKHIIVCDAPDISPRHRLMSKKAEERRQEYLKAAQTPVPTPRLSRTPSRQSSSLQLTRKTGNQDLRSSAAMFREPPPFIIDKAMDEEASFHAVMEEIRKSTFAKTRLFPERESDYSEYESSDILDLDSDSFSSSSEP
jgi:hypothetical protein